MQGEGDAMAFTVARIGGVWTAAVQGRSSKTFASRAEALAWLEAAVSTEHMAEVYMGPTVVAEREDVEVAHG